MKLIEAPIGLLDCDGTIILKTDYSTPHTIDCETKISPDCYIVKSGEYFWGGVDSVEARNNLEVTPVEMPTLTPPNEPLTLEQLREMNGEPVWVTSARERGNIPSRWVLFAGVSKSKRNSDVFVFATTGGIGQGYEAVNYGKTWNAYRRPPEGEEDK